MARTVPALPPEVPQRFLPRRAGDTEPYRPHIYGSALVHFGDRKEGAGQQRRVNVLLPLDPAMRSVDWDRAEPIDATPDALLAAPPADAPFLKAPAFVSNLQRFSKLARDFDRWLGRTQRGELLRYPPLRLASVAGESQDEFIARARLALRKKRDLLADRLRRKRRRQAALSQLEVELEALPDASEISADSLERKPMRPRRGGTNVDLVAVLWK